MSKIARSKPERTPGPWEVNGEVFVVSGQRLIAITSPQWARDLTESERANAAFIVTACNAYDADRALIAALVAALRAFVDAAMDDYKLDRAHKQAVVALSRAEKEGA